MAELEKQLQSVHEKLAVLSQGPIAKPKLKGENNEKWKNKKTENIKPSLGLMKMVRGLSYLDPLPKEM